jgi:Zn finger protein HypA/HybF involved in hydrogenase expression
MAVKLTLELFKSRAYAVHSGRYGYNSVAWTSDTNSQTKVAIVCTDHGIFTQRVFSHLQGTGCPECSRIAKSYSQELFLTKAQRTHGTRYDYSLVEWVVGITNARTKITINCRAHGPFIQQLDSHIRGCGCPTCGGSSKLSLEQFLDKARRVHGARYDYTSVEWSDTTNAYSKVSIECPTHGSFRQLINNHTNNKMGCMACGGRQRHTRESFVIKAQHTHGTKYDYSTVVWTESTNARTKVTINCKIHGPFNQVVDSHIAGTGCPPCNSSKGEMAISTWLNANDIKYTTEHIFSDCINPITKRKLRFDFYLPDHNTCIEFHGKQHYIPVLFTKTNFGESTSKIARDNLSSNQHRDSIKEQYCKQRGMHLIIIPYTDITRIDLILTTHLLTKKDNTYDI